MKKIAVSNDEDLVRVKAMLESRERTKEEVNSFFENAKKARKQAVGTMDKLLVQAPLAQPQQPSLQKEAAEARTDTDRAKKWGRVGAGIQTAMGVGNMARNVVRNPTLPSGKTVQQFAKAHPKTALGIGAGVAAGNAVAGYAQGRLAHRLVHGKATGKPLAKEAAAMLEAHETAKEEVVGTHIEEFFEKRAYLTEAQKRYPELLKVGATDTSPQKPPAKKLPGQIPARSQLAGGQV